MSAVVLKCKIDTILSDINSFIKFAKREQDPIKKERALRSAIFLYSEIQPNLNIVRKFYDEDKNIEMYKWFKLADEILEEWENEDDKQLDIGDKLN